MDRVTREVTKQLMITVPSEVACNIIREKQKLLLRKLIPHDYRGWVNCVIGSRSPYLVLENKKIRLYERYYGENKINGHVLFRFWFDEYEEVSEYIKTELFSQNDLLKLSGTTYNQLKIMKNNKELYAWHIKELQLFNKIKSISDYKYLNHGVETIVSKAPKKYLYVWERMGEMRNE